MPIDYSGFALNKPPKKPKSKPSYAVYRQDGTIERIVLSKTEWDKLTQWCWDTFLAIDGLVRCHIGAHVIQSRHEFVLDHPLGRGMNRGHQDDRTVKPACHMHNGIKGSVRM
jgi:hypothetical protein